MTEFSDNFNRPDGPVGNGWTTPGYGGIIVGNKLSTSLPRACYRDVFGAGNTLLLRSVLDSTSTNGHRPSLIFKYDPASGDRFQVNYANGSVAQSISIMRYTGVNATQIGYAQWSPATTGPHTLEVRYQNGAISTFLDTVARATANDSAYQDHTQLGYWLPDATTRADDFYCTDTWGAALDVEPEPLVEMAIPEEITFTGTGTSWTPGVPGVPTFTVDKGTIDSQEITSATQGTGFYTPPQATDTATFTDPSTGQTDQVALSTGFQVDAGGECKLTDDGAAIVNAAGAAHPNAEVLTTEHVVSDTYGIDIIGFFGELLIGGRKLYGESPSWVPGQMGIDDGLWWILNGHEPADPESNVLAASLGAYAAATNAETGVGAIRTNNLLDLQDILDAITGIPPVDVSEILAQLAAIRTDADLTLQSVIDAVQQAQGSGLPTIRDVLDQLAAIRTASNYTLGHVYTWVNGLRGSSNFDLTTLENAIHTWAFAYRNDIIAAVNALKGNDNVDLTQLHDSINSLWINVNNVLQLIRTEISHVRGADNRDLTQVYNAIRALPQTQVDLTPVLTAISSLSTQLTNTRADILAAINAQAWKGPPVWPGVTHVTYGAPVTGTLALTVPGPLHGLVLRTIVHPNDILGWQVGDRVGLKWAGAVTFVSDDGDTEEVQFPATDRRVLTPKAMLVASSALVSLRPGIQAAATPWTVNA